MEGKATAARRGTRGLWIGLAAGLGACGVLSVCALLAFGLVGASRLSSAKKDTLLWIRSVDWSADGTRLAAGSADGCFTIWEANSGAQLGSIANFPGQLRSVEWSPDDVVLATGNDSGPVIDLWDAKTGRHIADIDSGNSLGYLAWSPGGDALAVTQGTFISLREADTGREVQRFSGQGSAVSPITGIVWSPDGTRIASSGADSTVVVWDVASGSAIHTLSGHKWWVNDLDWSPDGAALASGGDYGIVVLWDPESGELIRELEGHSWAVYGVAWSPVGDQLATAGLDDRVILWNPHTGDVLARLTEDVEGFLSVAWSPDGTRLAAGTGLDTVLVWDVATQELVLTLPSACKSE